MTEEGGQQQLRDVLGLAHHECPRIRLEAITAFANFLENGTIFFFFFFFFFLLLKIEVQYAPTHHSGLIVIHVLLILQNQLIALCWKTVN